MPIQPAPAILIGLGARIFLDVLRRAEEAPISSKDYILLGIWQGVALHYAFRNCNLGLPVSFAIAAKLLIELNIYPDLNRCITTLIGVALGFLGMDLIVQVFDSTFSRPHPSSPEQKRRKVSHSTPELNGGHREGKKRERMVQFRASVQGGSVSDQYAKKYHPVSDITSVDSNSELVRAKENMTPVEREIAALRARASLADSERRRCKEERKWAISEGNKGRADFLKQEVKRYTVLMQSFHREADLKMLSASQTTLQINGTAGEAHRTASSSQSQDRPRVRRSSLNTTQPPMQGVSNRRNSTSANNSTRREITR